MAFVKKAIKATFFFLPVLALSAPWNQGIEIGTSVAQSYGSRNLFTNPAALAFEKELNGVGLLSSFTYGSTFNHHNEFSVSGAYSLLGLGYEKLSNGTDDFSRYQIGIASALNPYLFWGTRISTTSSHNPSLSNNLSWDLGFQYRPLPVLSLGLIVSELNQSTINGVKSPSIYTLGAAFRPWSWITLTSDLETPSNNFAKTLTAQATIAVEPLKGLTLSSGYQSDHRFQVGIQWDLAKASLYSVVHPSPNEAVKPSAAHYTLGFQTSVKVQNSNIFKPRELLITLDENLSEEGKEASWFSSARPSLLNILESIQSAANHSSIETITVRVEEFPLGLAAAEEVAEALLNARSRGKKVEVFLSSAKTKEYLIASGGSDIYLEPSGEISLLGARISHYFAKGSLDKIGIEGEFLAKGDYKSAPEFFTRKESSAKSRQATQHELKMIEESLVDLLGKTRKMDRTQWNSWLRVALFGSQEALKHKLIDHIGSYDDIKSERSGSPKVSALSQFSKKSLSLPDRVAVITASGNILQKKTRLLGLTGQSQVTPEGIEPLFDKALKDPRTKAIVLRVSSPGGEVLASEQIANTVARAKIKKPVIVSMGDVAASGGYFISAPAQKILANRLTLTGSIGVFLGKFNFGGLYKKLDLNKEVLGTGPYASIDSEHKSWTQEERAIMQKRLNQFYDSFVDFVAKNRKLSFETAEQAARGRVWLGKESIGLKIVDQSGGLLEAIETAKNEAGIQNNYEIYPIRESLNLFEALSEETLPGAQTNLGLVKELLDSDLQKSLAKALWMKQQTYLYWAPLD